MSAAYNLKKENLIDVLTQYKDICASIEFYEILLQDAEIEYKRSRKVLIGGPTAKPSHSPIERQYEGTKDTISRYEEIEKVLEKKKKLKKDAEEALRKFEGIEYQVAYKRFVEKKTLAEIADEGNYSLVWIKKVSQRINSIL